MADWLVEEGIAEHRAVRLEGDRIVEARLHWPDRLAAGAIVEARLAARASGSSRGTARAASGEEILLDRLPRDASEGAALRVAVTRAAIDGPGRLKRAQGRPSDAPVRSASLAATLAAAGHEVAVVRRFPSCDWDALIAEALHGETGLAGGALLFAATPAMSTIDIDGELPPRALALAAVPALADALRRFDVGGSAVIDFPTLPDKADRRAIDAALGEALGDWPHERTAMNGFGLVQIVARLAGPSLLQRAAWARSALVWRNLLRRAEALDEPGAIELAIHPRLESAIAADHLAELERRSGRRVRIRKTSSIDPDTPHAQIVADD